MVTLTTLFSTVATLFSLVRVINTRRQLQMRAPPGRQITFVEAVVHAFYDTTDKLLDTVNDEYERILAITEDRARRREQLYLTGPASASHVPRIESRQHEALKALSSSPSSSSSS